MTKLQNQDTWDKCHTEGQGQMTFMSCPYQDALLKCILIKRKKKKKNKEILKSLASTSQKL
jgi:hypothetical protein